MTAHMRLLVRERLLELAGRPGLLPGYRIIGAPRPPADLDIARVVARLAADQAVTGGRN